MLTLHHLEYSQSIRIVWLLEELQLEYELKLYKRTPDALAPPELKKISPTGTSPCITDDPVVLSETNAIVDYILDKASADERVNAAVVQMLRPGPGSPNRVPYLLWFHSTQASVQALMSIDFVLLMLEKKTPCLISGLMKVIHKKTYTEYIGPRLEALLQMAEQQLTSYDYLGGTDLTAADIVAVYTFDSALQRVPNTENYSRCKAWFDRITHRPTFEAAMKKVGQDIIALAI